MEHKADSLAAKMVVWGHFKFKCVWEAFSSFLLRQDVEIWRFKKQVFDPKILVTLGHTSIMVWTVKTQPVGLFWHSCGLIGVCSSLFLFISTGITVFLLNSILSLHLAKHIFVCFRLSSTSTLSLMSPPSCRQCPSRKWIWDLGSSCFVAHWPASSWLFPRPLVQTFRHCKHPSRWEPVPKEEGISRWKILVAHVSLFFLDCREFACILFPGEGLEFAKIDVKHSDE